MLFYSFLLPWSSLSVTVSGRTYSEKNENPLKEHHWHLCLGRMHPKHTQDNLLSFTLFQPLYFKVTWCLLPNACWQGWVFWMLSLPRCPIFCQRIGGVIPAAGILSKPHQGNSRVFQTGWLCKTYCTGRWDSQLDTILFHAVGGNHQPRSFLPPHFAVF